MKFSINIKGQNALSLARKAGYIPDKSTGMGELAFVRPLDRDYPRFHLYTREVDGVLALNLHLDQKRPTYGGHTAHSGEYEGELVSGEARRIMSIFSISARENVKENEKNPSSDENAGKLGGFFRRILDI